MLKLLPLLILAIAIGLVVAELLDVVNVGPVGFVLAYAAWVISTAWMLYLMRSSKRRLERLAIIPLLMGVAAAVIVLVDLLTPGSFGRVPGFVALGLAQISAVWLAITLYLVRRPSR